MKRLVLFASGSGSNAENIARYFQDSTAVEISLLLSNNPKAKVLERANRLGLSAMTFNKEAFRSTDRVLQLLQQIQPDLIVLAGFLWKIPESMVAAFPNRIINIHPALLPKYGGKGMYGSHVHKAVIANRETQSGITIHYVNENYDEGAVIFQASCELDAHDTVETLSAKIHELEMEHFPEVIKTILAAH